MHGPGHGILSAVDEAPRLGCRLMIDDPSLVREGESVAVTLIFTISDDQ
jgi:hypothetical protein